MCTQADALTMRYRQILKRIMSAKIKMGELMKEGAFALVQAKYVTGDGVKHTIFDAVESASVKARHPARQRAPALGGPRISSLQAASFPGTGQGRQLQAQIQALPLAARCRRSTTHALGARHGHCAIPQVKASTDNVAGVKLPRFEVMSEGAGSKMDMAGLGKGGAQLQSCRKKYLEARVVSPSARRSARRISRAPRCNRSAGPVLTAAPKALQAIELLIELASLQTAFITLDNAIKSTNRRVNALENVVTPRLENTITYIKARCPLAGPAAASSTSPPEPSERALYTCMLCSLGPPPSRRASPGGGSHSQS